MTDRRRSYWGLVSAAVLLAGAAGLAAAKLAGVVSSDLVMRGIMVMIGLMTVLNGNAAAKTFNPKAPTAHQQSATRFFGWAMTFAGFAWAGLWAFAPIGVALIAAPALVLAVLIVWLLLLRRGGKSDGVATPL